MTQINKPPVVHEIAVDQPAHYAKLAPEPPVSTIRGMCRGIHTDVPNDGLRDLFSRKAPWAAK